MFSLSSGYPYQPSQNEVLREKLEVLGKKEEERLSAGQAKLLRLLELKDSQVRQLTSDQLDTLWSPTFDWRSRFYCFWTAPLVLILLNSVLVRKCVFFYHRCPRRHIRLHPFPSICTEPAGPSFALRCSYHGVPATAAPAQHLGLVVDLSYRRANLQNLLLAISFTFMFFQVRLLVCDADLVLDTFTFHPGTSDFATCL